MKMMLRRLAIVVCVALALLSAAYAFAVLRTHSGTGFWKVWLVLAVVFALLAIGIACHWWAALPRIIRGAIIAVVAIGIVAFCTIEGCIIGNMNAQGEPDLDYVIVLGAQVRESGPSKALRYRLDRTIDYLEENPDTICIVSGGQGHNEPFAEAQGMIICRSMGLRKTASSRSPSRNPLWRTSSTARSSCGRRTLRSVSSPMISTCSVPCRSHMPMV